MPPLLRGLLGCCFLCGWALGGPGPLHALPPLSSPMWVLPEGAEAALAFLYSGDAQQLLGANCSEHYEAQGARGRPGLPPTLQRAAGTLAQAANFLNMLLQANDIRESSVEEDVEWYQALVRSVTEGDPKAYRVLLTFNPPPGASHLQLALQATRMGEKTILQDLSGNRVQEESPAETLHAPALQKRVLTNDLGSLGSPKWALGDGYVGDMQHVKLSPPFLECQGGQLRPGWLITLSATFYGLKPDLSPEVRGQVRMDLDLQRVDINQCAHGPGWYSNTHLCDLNSTQCVPLERQGFVLGRYLCRCRPGFYGASHSGGLEESAAQPTGQFGSPPGSSGRLLRCQPCAEGCTSCEDASPCLAEEAPALRAAVLACQACCLLAVFLSMLVSYGCRGSTRIRASGVVLLETILFGSLLLYFPVFILYFKPSGFRCIALRWVRLMGFALVYGTIILRLYRMLQLFLSRSAQRGPHLSSGRLLRRLARLLLLVLGFLAVWTVGVLERGILHMPLVVRGHTPTGRHFYRCHHDHWDYLMVVVEMLLLGWGSFLCFASRAVPSAFHEPRYMGIALHNELLFSAAFHVARFMLVPSLHPDWTLLLFFFHTHSTVTSTLALIFIPKFRKPGAPPREEMADEVYEDELQCSGSYFDSSTASAWSERSLDPGDIREELKKLYAQLEVHKTKEMAANNPHLPKKRGPSRQGLGRSFMRYLAEFPEALARQRSRDWGSPGRGSLPGSSRRRLLSSSSQDPEGPPVLRKSRSTYDHGRHRREQDPQRLDSLLRRKLALKVPQPDSPEAVEGPPGLGCRSASAHNLTVGDKLPRARPASLHKSLSVKARADCREKARLLASQACLEETYWQAKAREERKQASGSPVRRPSAGRLERACRAPLSAPPSPAKSSSMDICAPGKLQEMPRPPLQHRVSTPVVALAGACLGEPTVLSPTCTLAPAPGLTPALAPVPVPPTHPCSPHYICPWESAELPVKKEKVAEEGPAGTERGNHSLAPARARLWRALSVAVEKRGAREKGVDTEDRSLQREADDVDEDRPRVFSKSRSLKPPAQQCSVRSPGLALRVLTRSRSTHREKERAEGRAAGAGVGTGLTSPRLGRHKVVRKQAALAPCEDEESLQNQQNAHTSRMRRVCLQEGSRDQDRGSRTSQGQGEGPCERAGDTGPALLGQVRQGPDGDTYAERAKETPVGRHELLRAGLQPLGNAESRVAEVCPWEVMESGTWQPDSRNKAEICPWQVSEGAIERPALRQDLNDAKEEKGAEESEPEDVVAIAQKKPERLVGGQEAVCPWENADPGDLAPQSAPQDSERTKGMSEAGCSVEAGEVKHRQEVAGLEACTLDITKAELCPWEASGGENENVSQEGEKTPSQEKQKTFKKATFWKEQEVGRDLESLCSWERTDFSGPLAVSTEAPEPPKCSGSLGSSLAEVCPWEAGGAPASRKAEICPWELSDEAVGKELLRQGTGGEPLQEEGQAARKGLFGAMGEQIWRAKQTASPQQESVCPGESTAPGRSSSGAGGQLLSHGGRRATQVRPGEDLRPAVRAGAPAKAEICPWEVSERTTEDWASGEAPKGGESQKEKENVPGTSGIKDVRTWGKPEGQIPKQEAVCPWESVNTGSFPPQPGPPDTGRPNATHQVSGGVGSTTAAICPWDLKETLPTVKAEICPWEVSAGAGEEQALGVEAIRKLPNVTRKSADSGPRAIAVTSPKKPERPALEQAVVCPWESVAPGGSSQHPDTVNSDRPKARFQELDHVEGRPAKGSPWEAEEVSTSEKARICPWEVNERATGKGREQEMGSDSAGQRVETLERGTHTSLEEDRSKKTKLSQQQEAICPWEKDMREPSVQAPEVSDLSSTVRSKVAEGQPLEVSDEAAERGYLTQDPKMGSLQGHITQEKAPTSKTEVMTEDGVEASNELQSVCPRERMAQAGSSAHPDGQCPDPPKAGAQRLVSVEDRHAEVCPWDAPAPGAHQPDSSAKAEICPWEVTARTPEKVVSRQDGEGEPQEKQGKVPAKPEPRVVAIQGKLERVDRTQEAVCPWQSQERGGLSPQSAPQASDRSQGSSEVAGSVGARVAEERLGDVEEAPSANRTEICPWEVSKAGAEEGGPEQDGDREPQGRGKLFLQKAASGGTEEHFSKAAVKGSREQETVSPWEDTGSGGLFPQPDAPDTDQLKVSPPGASRVGSRMAELFQWEITDPEGNKIIGTTADISPWEESGAPSEESGHPALTATRAEIFFSTAPENPPCLSVQKPQGGFLPESKSPRPKVSKPASTFTLEGVTELQEPSELGPRTSLAPEPSLQGTEAQKSSSLSEDQGEVASTAPHEEFPPPVYPWDWE